ncbi:MAG: pyruvate carboxylase subunit B [Candidatus Thorarchaeota archaeon]|nr:MAG: oxaloacetate decarboxylase subunit alpha [Candidatus Thorarchaeota archaeon]RLI56443.1 MAG: oxaloacetate decarboxylase subunit alpha [Candidatus Thorarchaeota archaeon]
MTKLMITDTVLRDAHQSLLATRMKTEDMIPVCEKLDKVGYWSLEMFGGATFDSMMRFLDEDPWERLETLRDAMPHTRLQMLLRGQNIVGYRHYADDVLEAFVVEGVKAGLDVFRIFDALNDVRNMKAAMKFVKREGGFVEASFCYTLSPFHSNEKFVEKAKELYALDADSICIKDMAGLISPEAAYDLVKRLKEEVDIPIHLHSHYTSGMASMAYLRAADAGVDIVDCAISSLSMATSQPATESIVEALKGTPRDTGLDLNLLAEIADHFRRVRRKYGQFEGSLQGVNPQVLVFQVPGGMLSNLDNQLKEQGALDRYDEVLAEVPRVRAELGYPPLVTPSSQIVGTQATLNVVTGKRYSVIPTEIKQYVRGYYGRPPAEIDPEVKRLAIGDEEPLDCRPADLLEPELPKAREALKDVPHTDRDLVSYALFPQYALNFFKRRAAKRKRGEMTPELEVAIIASVLHMEGISGRTVRASAARGDAWPDAGRAELMEGRSSGYTPARWERASSAWATAGRRDTMKRRDLGGV